MENRQDKGKKVKNHKWNRWKAVSNWVDGPERAGGEGRIKEGMGPIRVHVKA